MLKFGSCCAETSGRKLKSTCTYFPWQSWGKSLYLYSLAKHQLTLYSISLRPFLSRSLSLLFSLSLTPCPYLSLFLLPSFPSLPSSLSLPFSLVSLSLCLCRKHYISLYPLSIPHFPSIYLFLFELLLSPSLSLSLYPSLPLSLTPSIYISLSSPTLALCSNSSTPPHLPCNSNIPPDE